MRGLSLVHSSPAPEATGTPAAGVLAAPGEPSVRKPLPAKRRAAARALIVADFTADDFATRLQEDAESPLIDADVAPFGQVHQTLLSLSTQDPKPDLVVVWTRPETCAPAFGRVLSLEPVTESELIAEVDSYVDLLQTTLADCKCAVIPIWTMPWYDRGAGLGDTRKGGAMRALLTMNARLLERLDALSNVHALNAQRWTASGGRSGQTAKLWYVGKIAFSAEVITEAVKDTKAALRAALGAARKLVVVDLDDTMWGGIVGDAGWENLRLGGHDSVGEAFVDLQRALKNLKRRGVLLAIASKNEESVALEAIRSHPEMVLREDDFVTWRINWNDKARNIVEMASELNLGLQSIVFLDDNPVERARVRETLPEVLVPELPQDNLTYPGTLLNLACFDALSVTEEDLGRTEMYVAERKRNSLIPQIGSIEDWNSGLDIKVVASPLGPANIVRVVQLLNKTNQLNLSTRRLSQVELQTWAADPRRELWVIRVSDRFGDYGLTGIVSIEVHASTAQVVDYVLSCRVMGRKVEEALVHVAVEVARARGLGCVEAHYVPTAKNKPCHDFWQRSGFEQADEHVFVWDVSRTYECPAAITLVREEGWENDAAATISERVS
jgi:FkbH-like protein